MIRLTRAMGIAIISVLLVLPAPSLAVSVTRDGFAFPSQGDVKIVVFRPDVHVGSLRVGGVDDPNPDWTANARSYIQTAMENNAEARQSNMRFLPDIEGADGAVLNEYRGLFEAVSTAIMQHGQNFNRLPTKQIMTNDPKAPKRYVFDWTLGVEASRLKAITGGDYALFFFTYDSYGDAGRKVAQLLMAGLFGAYIPAGIHIGYAGLVDLNDGNVVWFNTDIAMGGDVREADGAVKRVGQLLRGFPVRSVSADSKTAPANASVGQ